MCPWPLFQKSKHFLVSQKIIKIHRKLHITIIVVIARRGAYTHIIINIILRNEVGIYAINMYLSVSDE